jgi:hypothetical protein
MSRATHAHGIGALCLVTLLLACENSALEGPSSSPPEPAFDWTNNPDVGNVRIARYGTYFAISWTDPQTGLRATHTNFPLGTEPGCGPGSDLDPLSQQDVGLVDPNDFLLSWLRTNLKGKVWIFVRDTNEPGDCAGDALIAEGIGSLHYVDNDPFAWYQPDGSTRQNDNAFTLMAEGRLTGVGGGTMEYSGLWHFAWDPQNWDFHAEQTQVVIH